MRVDNLEVARAELEESIRLPKCQKCGCMRETLDALAANLPSLGTADALAFAENVSRWSEQTRTIQYACLGCEHCYPAVAQNALTLAFPTLDHAATLSCDFQLQDAAWPAVVGEYAVLDKASPVAVSTLGSVQLGEELAHRKPRGLAIVGKTETENIGVDKVVKNIITNPALRYLIVAGVDPKGHQPGKTLLALAAHGVDASGRVIGSPSKRPILRNVSADEIQPFREQVQIIDMIGCERAEEIITRIEELAQQSTRSCGCSECAVAPPVSISTAPKIIASDPSDVVKLDKAGYFVIVPVPQRGIITVEHYTYDNTLLRVIEGTNARTLYGTIISNGWVTELSHAAYLGKELTKSELSLQYGFAYVQDGA